MLTEHSRLANQLDTRLIFIVDRDRPTLYDHLREGCHGIERIDVLVDRRQGDRRRWGVPTMTERRQNERRNWRVEDDLGTFGFAIVLATPPAGHERAPTQSRPVTSLPATLMFLRDVALFRNMDDVGLAVLAGRLREEIVPAGHTLVREGESGNRMFVIRDGTLVVSKAVSDRVEKVLVHMKHGEFFGEMSLFTRRRRSASVRALTDSVVLALDRDGLVHLIETHPKSALALLSTMVEEFSNRLSNTDEMVAEVTRWGLLATGLEGIDEDEGP